MDVGSLIELGMKVVGDCGKEGVGSSRMGEIGVGLLSINGGVSIKK